MKYRIGMIIIGVLLLCAFATNIGTQEEEITTHEVLGRLLMMVLADTTKNHTFLEYQNLQLTQINEELRNINKTLKRIEEYQSGVLHHILPIGDSVQKIERKLQPNEERE